MAPEAFRNGITNFAEGGMFNSMRLPANVQGRVALLGVAKRGKEQVGIIEVDHPTEPDQYTYYVMQSDTTERGGVQSVGIIVDPKVDMYDKASSVRWTAQGQTIPAARGDERIFLPTREAALPAKLGNSVINEYTQPVDSFVANPDVAVPVTVAA